MLGTIVNSAAIILGSLLGLLLKKGIPERFGDTINKGLALCVLLIGISGALTESNIIITIIAMVLGAIIGEALKLDMRINRFGDVLQAKFKRENEKSTISQGYVTATLLFCVGAMAIVGSLQSGIDKNYTTLFTKSIIDGVSAIILTSSLGIGVMLSAASVFALQGTITILAQWVAPLMTDAMVNQLTAVGSLMIIGIALNMMGLTKLKVINYVPGIFVAIGLVPLVDFLSALI